MNRIKMGNANIGKGEAQLEKQDKNISDKKEGSRIQPNILTSKKIKNSLEESS